MYSFFKVLMISTWISKNLRRMNFNWQELITSGHYKTLLINPASAQLFLSSETETVLIKSRPFMCHIAGIIYSWDNGHLILLSVYHIGRTGRTLIENLLQKMEME